MTYREEEDSLGKVKVPEEAYYGAQTQRAVENFPVSGLRFPRAFIRALGLIKKHAALVNADLGRLDGRIAEAIARAAGEVAEGRRDGDFVVDVFQTGSGTSTNMNANEVVAGRANEILTGRRGGRAPVHPNDHVNLGQSSNDVIPTATHIAVWCGVRDRLLPSVRALQASLEGRAAAFGDVVKIGRTHLQDALPLTLGQEFGGYARQVSLAATSLGGLEAVLSEVALGGTAVGTGANTHPAFAGRAIEGISRETGCVFREAADHFAAQAGQEALVRAGGVLKGLAVALAKVANDIRWLASGPRCGLGEIRIPSLQPGSSIMPGKVNPVIPEMVLQVAAQVVGNEAALTLGGLGGHFELNMMLPLMAHNLLQSVEVLSNAVELFSQRCVSGIEADRERCAASVERSLALATALVPALGYDGAAAVAKEAARTGESVRHAALRMGVLPEGEIAALLDEMIKPGASGEVRRASSELHESVDDIE